MLPVSEAYAKAIKLPNRVDRLTGKIILSDGTSITITDDIVMNNSVTLTEQLVSGNTMEIGTFFTNQLTITVYDEKIQSRSYANAKIVPYYGLQLPDGTWEDIPLGVFKVDNSYTRRKGPRHMLTAFDCSVEFDRDISGHTVTATLQAHIASACKEVGVAMSPDLNLSDFPNADVVVNASSKSIQTYRDLIEWCAALMGASAKIDRYGKFTLIVLDDKTEGTQYIYDVVIDGDERFGTEFFDLRALTKYVSTTFDGQAYVNTRNNWLNDEQGRNAVVFVPENPLLKDNENAEEIFINSLSTFTIALRSAEFSFIGNPALECFDTVGVSGGQIDSRGTIAIFPTKLMWKYRGKHSVSCAFAELTEEPSSSEVSTIATLALSDNTLPVPVKVRNQTEKRIDGVEGGGSGGVTGTFNVITSTNLVDGSCEHTKRTLEFTNGLLTAMSEEFPELLGVLELCPDFYSDQSPFGYPLDSSLYYDKSDGKIMLYADIIPTEGEYPEDIRHSRIKVIIPKTVLLKTYMYGTLATRNLAFRFVTKNPSYETYDLAMTSCVPILSAFVANEAAFNLNTYASNIFGNENIGLLERNYFQYYAGHTLNLVGLEFNGLGVKISSGRPYRFGIKISSDRSTPLSAITVERPTI